MGQTNARRSAVLTDIEALGHSFAQRAFEVWIRPVEQQLPCLMVRVRARVAKGRVESRQNRPFAHLLRSTQPEEGMVFHGDFPQ